MNRHDYALLTPLAWFPHLHPSDLPDRSLDECRDSTSEANNFSECLAPNLLMNYNRAKRGFKKPHSARFFFGGAIRENVLQCVAVYCSVLQCVTVCCSVLQCVAVCCRVLQCVFRVFSECFQCVAVGRSLSCALFASCYLAHARSHTVSHSVLLLPQPRCAVCCSVLQRVAVCSTVL